MQLRRCAQRWAPLPTVHSQCASTSSPLLLASHRLCSSQPPTASPPQPPPTLDAPRRRSKRLNYADADKVYADAAAHTLHTLTEKDAEVLRAAAVTVPSQTSLRSLHSSSVHKKSSVRRLGTRVQQRWYAVLLSLLHTRYVGACVVRLLEASAYAAYVKGSVVLFSRHRVGPALTEATPITTTSSTLSSVTYASPVASPRTGGHDTTERNTVAGSAGGAAGVSSGSDAGLLHEHALDCLYIGQSRIHSRGIFTRKALRKGTRIIAEPRRSLLLSPHFLTLLADTHEKLPDTWHYTQPTGSVVELVTQAQPHHLLNHSCNANVCSGLSNVFWEAATLATHSHQQEQQQQRGKRRSGNGVSEGGPSSSLASTSAVSLQERMTQWPYFADANSFFVTRDVAAGEELTLNYSTRMAPLYAGESRHGVQAQGWLLCRCGEPCCRHYVYRHTTEAAAYLHQLTSGNTRSKRRRQNGLDESANEGKEMSQSTSSADEKKCAGRTEDFGALQVAAKLLELGFDDELVLLSYAARPVDIVAYLYGEPLPSFHTHDVSCGDCKNRLTRQAHFGDAAALMSVEVERRRVSKRDLLLSYRHVFRLLNEAVPQTFQNEN